MHIDSVHMYEKQSESQSGSMGIAFELAHDWSIRENGRSRIQLSML